VNVTRLLMTTIAVVSLAPAGPAWAQDGAAREPAAAAEPAPPAPGAPQDPDPLVLNLAEPDFTLSALPTTLRLPRHKSAFRVTHRFARPLGAGTFGDLVGDLFGLDGGAQIGLEFRFGLTDHFQAGIHRTNDKSIQFLGQHSIVRQQAGRPVSVDALVTAEGADNFSEDFASAIGVVVSRQASTRAAVYVEPMFVANANPNAVAVPGGDDRHTFMIGLGARLRVGQSAYVVAEVTPRVAGYDRGVHQVSIALEKRAGGHAFQLNVSNGFGTTFRQVARGGPSNDDWYLGFNISRKFF